MAIQITNEMIEERAQETARALRNAGLIGRVREVGGHRVHKLPAIYGIPRGGIPCAYALQAALGTGIVVDDIKQANIIVDDIVDSGSTRDRYLEMAPSDAVFCTFYDASNHDDWLVFPWEGNELQSAADIPTRLLQYVGEDAKRGGLAETPMRFLKAWKHFTSGYDANVEDVLKVFEDGAEKVDEMVLVKNIPLYSQCEHHMVPFFGVAHIAYIPNGKIVGLSKLSRVTDIYARRLQVQERLTNQIADALEKHLNPKGVAVVLECRHLCMEARGISQQGSTTITSAMRGVFRESVQTRNEFMGLIK